MIGKIVVTSDWDGVPRRDPWLEPCADPNCEHGRAQHNNAGQCQGQVLYESSGGTWYERPCDCQGWGAAEEEH